MANSLMNPLMSPDYNIGDIVSYNGDPENLWKILDLRAGALCWWVYASQNGTKQNFPAAVFVRHDMVKKSNAPTPAPTAPTSTPKAGPKPKKKSIGDPVSDLLAEAANIQECWTIAELAGLDMADLRIKIGHLSNGLQRMGIGNRLRAKAKKGEFDASTIIRTSDGFKSRSICTGSDNQDWNVYVGHGYRNRADYLQCMADDYGLSLGNAVMPLADLLGPNEDFDGLISSLDDYSDGMP